MEQKETRWCPVFRAPHTHRDTSEDGRWYHQGDWSFPWGWEVTHHWAPGNAPERSILSTGTGCSQCGFSIHVGCQGFWLCLDGGHSPGHLCVPDRSPAKHLCCRTFEWYGVSSLPRTPEWPRDDLGRHYSVYPDPPWYPGLGGHGSYCDSWPMYHETVQDRPG